MKKQLIISVLALALSIVLVIRVTIAEKNFNKEVEQSNLKSGGYDQEFIDVVNQLEKDLTVRAQFGYRGTKDPMTGQLREIPEIQQTDSVKPASIKLSTNSSNTQIKQQTGDQELKDTPVSNEISVSAILYDDARKVFTAVINTGAKTTVVGIGDSIDKFSVVSITKHSVIFQKENSYLEYDLKGQVFKR